MKDRLQSAVLMNHSGIECVEEVVVSHGLLRWYMGNWAYTVRSHWVSGCRVLKVERTKVRRRSRKALNDCVKV